MLAMNIVLIQSLPLSACSPATPPWPSPSPFGAPQKACGLLAAQGFATPAWTPTSFGYECSSTNLRIDYVVSVMTEAKRSGSNSFWICDINRARISTLAGMSSTG